MQKGNYFYIIFFYLFYSLYFTLIVNNEEKKIKILNSRFVTDFVPVLTFFYNDFLLDQNKSSMATHVLRIHW